MKKISTLILAALCLVLAGCSLARPEVERAEDRFAGFYVVRETWQNTSGVNTFWSSDNPLLEEYGSTAVDLGKYGTHAFPDLVLFARKEGGNYVFPGLEGGFSLFILHEERSYGSVTEVVSNMAPGVEGAHIKDSEDSYYETISGTIYSGPPLGAKDWDPYADKGVWQVYRVYVTPDGRPYINGEGNGFQGGFSGYTETNTYTTNTNGGKTREETLRVTVSSKTVPRLEKLVVTEFDAGNHILRSQELPLQEDLPDVRCGAETAWVLVEEVSAEGTKRTLYDIPAGDGEQPDSHLVVLLDDEGVGQLAYLDILMSCDKT